MSRKSATAFILLGFITILLTFPSLCINAAQEGLLLWFNKVLPSLLPFMILINILIGLDSIKNISSRATFITYKLWNLPGNTLFAFLMGLLAGYPMGGRVIKELVLSGDLTPTQGEKALCFCNNCGPLFIVGTVGTALLGNVKLGYFLLLVHVSSALLTSLLLKTTYTLPPTRNAHLLPTTSSKTLSALFNEAVAHSMDTMTCIGGYIIFFSVLAHLITDTWLLQWLFHLPLIDQLPVQTLQAVLTSFLELSNGVNALSHISSPYALALLAAALAFGGLCVYFQTLYVLQGIPISTKPYIFSKCLQAILSFLLTCVFYPLFSVYTQGTKIAFNYTWGIILILFISSFIILAHFDKNIHSILISFKQDSKL